MHRARYVYEAQMYAGMVRHTIRIGFFSTRGLAAAALKRRTECNPLGSEYKPHIRVHTLDHDIHWGERINDRIGG